MRMKKNLRVRRRYSPLVANHDLIGCDQTVVLVRNVVRARYPCVLRRGRVRDPDSGQSIILLTNHVALPATTISALYRHRWQIEIFFKWVKQYQRNRGRVSDSVQAALSGSHD
jgi:IS4 transposase